MNCEESQELLSIYHDGELDSERRVYLEVHLDGCPECLAELSEIRRLSAATKELTTRLPPLNLWRNIRSSLKGEPSLTQKQSVPTDVATSPLETACTDRSRRWLSLAVLSTAAILLLCVGIKWSIPTSRHVAHDHEPLKAYIQNFGSDSLLAQQQLADRYSGHVASADDAIRLVGYRPYILQLPPNGYSREAIYVLDMPCCKCVEALWKRSDGTYAAIFEHNEPLEDWFVGSPRINVACAGKNCRFVELGSQFAASWRVGMRMITVVGLRDTEELAVLVTTFSQTINKPS